MTLLALAALVSIAVGYIAVGRWYATRTATLDARNAREEWHYESSARGSFKARQLTSAWLWPFKMVGLAATSDLNSRWDSVDPERVAERERSSARRIAELERQLGIKRDAA